MDVIDVLRTAGICFAAAVAFMSVMFMVGRSVRRYDIVDTAWGLTFIVIALVCLYLATKPGLPTWLVTALVVVWGFRLSLHIFQRLLNSTREDKRYTELRAKWRSGNEAVNVYFRIYVTQAVLATIVMTPVIIISSSSSSSSYLFPLTGAVIWLIGFVIEVVADRQLREFLSQPTNRGSLMTNGLWNYSRHPNYFGELTQWWGIGIIALSVPHGWLGLIGPIVLSYIIIFVSGVRLSERSFLGRPGWAEYKARTSVLLPWPPK